MIPTASIPRMAIFTFLMLIACSVSTAQTAEGPIEISPTQKNAYLMNGEYLDTDALKTTMASNPLSMAYMKKADANSGFATAFSIAGGLLAGIPLGQALGGGDPNWALAGIGVGLFLVALPLEGAHNKNVRAAVEEYNRGLDSTSPGVQLQLGLSTQGLGFTLTF